MDIMHRIEELEANLRQTDWIVVKLAEYQVRGLPTDEILEKHGETLAVRDVWRAELSRLREVGYAEPV